MDNKELWTVEYSLSQGFFNFQPLDETINRNRYAIVEDVPSDWLVIHVCHSFEECTAFAETWYKAGHCTNYSIFNCMM